MKHVILGVLIVCMCCNMYIFANFDSSVSLDIEKETSYTTAVDTVLDKFTNKYSQSELAYKFPIIDDRITQALEKDNLPRDIIFVLEYLQRYVNSWIESNEDNNEKEQEDTTQIEYANSTKKTTENDISTSTYKEGEKTISSAEFSWPIVKFEITADFEDIIVEEFSISANNPNFDEFVSYVYIYNEDWVLIWQDNPNWNTAKFTEQIILKQWDNLFYVWLLPTDRDDISINTSFNLTMNIDEVSSSTNGNDIDSIQITNTEDTINIASAALGSAGIQLLETYNNWFVDSKMYNQARSDIAIISVDFSETTDNEDILLESLEFTLEDGTVAGDIHTTLKLKRIDTLSQDIGIDTKNEKQVTFDLNELWSKQEVKAWWSAVFLITGVPLLNPTQAESITIELNSTVTNNWILRYSTEDDTTIIGSIWAWYIGKTTIND